MTHTSKLAAIAHQPRFGAPFDGRASWSKAGPSRPRAAMVARTDEMFTPSLIAAEPPWRHCIGRCCRESAAVAQDMDER
jgi:hypothetical protein